MTSGIFWGVCVVFVIGAVPLASGAQLGDFLPSHFLGEQIVRLDDSIKRHFSGFENDPMTRTHIGRQRTRVPIEFLWT